MNPQGGAGVRFTIIAAIATALGTLALWPLFGDWQWYPPALATIAMVALVGFVARIIRWPLVLTPLAQGAGAVLLACWLYVRGDLWGGVVPTSNTIDDLRAVAIDGLTSIAQYAPPVPVSAGLTVLLMGGIALIAILVDVSSVTLRSPALAGLPLLALLMVPVSVIPGGTPWWCFLPGAIGWLLILATDSRYSTREWGAVLEDSASSAHAGSGARRAGAVAILLALVVPVVVPAFGEPLLGRGTGGGGGANIAGVSINPLVSLKRDYLDPTDRELLTVTSGAAQAPYLRLLALDTFDGTQWTASPFVPNASNELNAGMPTTVNGLAWQTSHPERSYTIRVGALTGPYLPQPYPAVRQTIGGGWFVDPTTLTVFSEQFSSANTVYTVTALDLGSDAETIRAGARAATGSGPTTSTSAEIPASVAALAQTITAGADNSFDKAILLQQWFRTNFRYSTSVRSGSDSTYLEQFLTERIGYCEQFAAAMALMARSQGIPARVAVGFAPGRAVSPGTWSVSSHNAHAWPELWIPGTGWTRFEPTPRSGDGSTITTPAYAPATSGNEPTSAPSASSSSTASPRDPRASAADRADRGTSSSDSSGVSVGRLAFVAVSALVLLVLALPLLVRTYRRRSRLHGSTHDEVARGAWAELRDSVIDYGRTWSASETPRQTGRRLVTSLSFSPDAAAAVSRLVAATEAAAYRAPGSTESGATTSVRNDLRTIRHALRDQTHGGARWAAVLFPRSARRQGSPPRETPAENEGLQEREYAERW